MIPTTYSNLNTITTLLTYSNKEHFVDLLLYHFGCGQHAEEKE